MIYLLIGATATVFVRESWPLYSFCIVAALLLAVAAGKRQLDPVRLLPFLIPAFGLVQLAASTSAYAPATRDSLLKWFALIAVLVIAEAQLADPASRDRFLNRFLIVSTVSSVLCLAQFHTSGGKLLWFFDTGIDGDIYGFFPSRNNYGQFVELALPIALWRSLAGGSNLWFAGTAGLLYASVVASTSRAAALLTTAELIVVPAVLLMQSRLQPELRRRAAIVVPAVVALAAAWTAVAGFDATLARFHEPDALQGRREFAQSAWAMAAAKPLAGFGLGTFSYVYPRFARVDYPEFVNFAHNDWAEFAAEGGILFALAILALFVRAAPRIGREPWALGLAFVSVHAWFDFPFPRIGVAGWMFALLGAVTATGSRPLPVPAARPLKPLVIAASLCVIYFCARLGLAGIYYSRDSPDMVRRAIRLEPDESRYYLRLAQLDTPGSAPLLRMAIALNPYNAGALIDSGLEAELSGDLAGAEQTLLRAAAADTTWLPRWTLANFYYRRGNAQEFWRWAEQAGRLANVRRDFVPLFHLALDLDPDPRRLLAILPNRPAPLRAFIGDQVEARKTAALETAAARLIATGDPGNDRPFVLWAIEGFLAQRDPDPALRLWNRMADSSWVTRDESGHFPRRPLQSSLAWKYADVDGVVRTVNPDGSLRLVFSGQQPEECDLVERYVALTPGVAERFRWRYRAEEIVPQDLGLRWSVQSLDGKELVPPVSVSVNEVKLFSTQSVVRIRLQYKRSSGSPRISGAVELAEARIVR
jgi:O-antigen ligase